MAASESDPCALQNTEISQIKEKYLKQCKVINDVGDFKNVVIIRPTTIDIVIKFQLTASYPLDNAAVIVRSDTIAVDCMPDITSLVDSIIAKNTGCPIISDVTEGVMNHIVQLGLDNLPEAVVDHKKSKGKSNSRKNQKGKSKHKTEEEPATDTKKPSMKTAEDVIKRIQWDENLPTDCFLVGYLDRFKGVMEKAFTAFSWEDLASADYDVLAIPKHRIQYFKYKDVFIWDKNKRLDYMFGSVGKHVTIHDVIDNYDIYKSSQPKQNPAYPSSASKDSGDFDDSDDDVEIDLGEAGYDNQLRPNHFFCIRITDPEILEGVEAMQDAILEEESRYASCCIRPSTLHLTLCTVGLDTPDEIVDARQVLEKAKQELQKLPIDDLKLRVERVDNFFDRVIYARVHHNEHFSKFVDHFRGMLTDGGIDIRDNYGYVPHVTIMKTTRPVSKELKTPKVKKSIYESFSDMYFGEQTVDGIYLCEMSDERQKDGFYVTHANIKL